MKSVLILFFMFLNIPGQPDAGALYIETDNGQVGCEQHLDYRLRIEDEIFDEFFWKTITVGARCIEKDTGKILFEYGTADQSDVVPHDQYRKPK